MARKRGLTTVECEVNKKRSPDSRTLTPKANSNPQQEKNILNDGLLSLYKKELIDKKDRPSTSLNESTAENKIEENGAANPKTPSRTGKRSKNQAFTPKFATVNFGDVGGMDDILEDLIDIVMHFKDPSLYKDLGCPPTRGVLLHGPPGCGKTHLARATAGELECPFIEVAATELVCGISGDSENNIRDTFDAAVSSGKCILFIDEIDAICPKRDTTESGMLRRMVNQMIKCFDELNQKDPDGNILVMGATNLPDSIDPALRGGLRFGQEFAIGIPNEEARLKILHILCKKMKLSPDFDLNWLAHNTPGYVGADLWTLTAKAMSAGISRMVKQLMESGSIQNKEVCPPDRDTTTEIRPIDKKRAFLKSFNVSKEDKEELYFEVEDFQVALQKCVPFSKREGFASVPDTTWADIGALEDVKKELRSTIMWPVQHSKFYDENKLSSTKGILLYGPKGCGKTLLAKAIANECSINFLSVNGPELLSMYVGESEKAVRKCFERARNSAPCVIFFDEFDALCPPRSSSKENAPVERVVNQLLTETCGIQERKQVFLIAATNRLEKIDSAMLRPGRLEKIIYVGLPTPAERALMLISLTKNKTRPKIADDLDLETIAFDSRCEEFSGADLAYLIREATTKAIEEMIESSLPLTNFELCTRHFDSALKVVKSSFSEQDRTYFQKSSSHSR